MPVQAEPETNVIAAEPEPEPEPADSVTNVAPVSVVVPDSTNAVVEPPVAPHSYTPLVDSETTVAHQTAADNVVADAVSVTAHYAPV